MTDVISDRDTLYDRLDRAAQSGMTLSVWAARQPERIAVYDPNGRTRSFADLNGNANRLAKLLRARGLKAGDALALICSNRAEFAEVLAATLRTGIRVTPVNWHLTAEEIAFIVRDCDAKAVVADARVASALALAIADCPEVSVRLAVGGAIAGFQSYDATLAPLDGSDISDPLLGNIMFYTSGTTGRPKGVLRAVALITPARSYTEKG
ncbi:MAG: AMP-binding protein, partial [Sphingobium sp.]